MTKAERQRSAATCGAARPSKARKRVGPPSRKRERDDQDKDKDDGDQERQKIARPDRSKKMQEGRYFSQYVVKCSFPGKLHPLLTEEVQAIVQELIDNRVEANARMVVRGSMVANATLLRGFERGLTMDPDRTFFRRCLTGDGRGDELIQAVMTESFQHHPHIDRPMGDWPIVNWSVNTFLTSYDNNLWMHFVSRLRGFVRDWVIRFDVEEDLTSVIANRILGYSCPKITVLPFVAWEFIDQQRALLDNPELFFPERAPREMLLRYMYKILHFRDTYGLPGRFSLVPINKVKRHYISICTTGLYYILSDVFRRLGERTPLWIQEVVLMEKKQAIREYRDMMWARTFDLPGLTRGEFIHLLDTDGVGASVHFRRPKVPAGPSTAPQVQGRRVISIDPGRVHIITAYERLANGRDKFYTLSRKSYYQPIRNSLDKLKYWESWLADINAELSLYSLRTANVEQCEGYRRIYFEQYERLWTFRLHKRRAREHFRIQAVKRSILDRFFMSFMKGPGARVKPIVIYGAARVHSHGNGGELGVPIKKVYKTCKRFFTTITANEYLTTKCHSDCGSRMHPMRTKGATRPIHGLLYCGTCHLMINRDRDACKSIMHVGISATRPEYLRFDRPYEKKGALTILPPLRKRKKT